MPQKHKYYYFNLDVPYHECQAIYLKPVPHVIIRAECGHRVQLPSAKIRQCITNNGLQGRFRLTVDDKNKLIEFIRL